MFLRLKCKNGHSIVSPRNVEVLRRHMLQDLSEKQLFQLLLQNDPWLLPEVSLLLPTVQGGKEDIVLKAACLLPAPPGLPSLQQRQRSTWLLRTRHRLHQAPRLPSLPAE